MTSCHGDFAARVTSFSQLLSVAVRINSGEKYFLSEREKKNSRFNDLLMLFSIQ